MDLHVPPLCQVLENVISVPELKRYVQIVRDMLSGKISTQDKRGDLGGHTERVSM